MDDWKIEHRKCMDDFLRHLNRHTSNFILKGGTALLACYGLDRFSEDIYLDCRGGNIFEIAGSFCDSRKYKYRVAKDTNTVSRIMLNYGSDSKPLKIEVSHRRAHIPESETTQINDISVYKIEQLSMMKASALTSRDKMRDLYDIAYICKNYYQELSQQAQFIIRNAVEHKGFEYYDYIIRQDNDEFIDTDKLGNDFLDMYSMLGLLCE